MNGVRKWMGLMFALLALTAWAVSATAQFSKNDETNFTTRASLILSADEARPGDTVMAGVHLKMAPHWHTYWKNPGLGIPIKVDWKLPAGITAGELQWPVPEKFVATIVTTYGYSDEVTLLAPLKIGASVPKGPLEIKANVSWQECDEQCVTGKMDVSARLNVGAETKASANVAALEAAKSKLPKADPNFAVAARWEKDGEKRPLIIEWESVEKPAEVEFFPYENSDYEVEGSVERLADAGNKISMRKFVTKSEDKWPSKISGLLVTRSAKDSPWQGRDVTLNLAPLMAGGGGGGAGASLFVMLGFAFIGGLILNIMPCVLPVLALKVLGFVGQAKEEPARVRKLGLVYGVGVLVSFLALALLAIGVQKTGELAGWSTALQNPQFRVVITVLITLVALNLFGVFEVTVSGRAMGAAGELVSKSGMAGAFFNGALATLLATPCTAPFLSPALAYAFTQPPGMIVLVFLAVGAGLAAPFVLLCWQPQWLKFLPKPGRWMERFKVAMGFPMLATAVWLFWATAPRMGSTGVLWFGFFLIVVALSAWIWGEFVQRGTKRRGLAMALSLIFVLTGYGGILEGQLHWRSPHLVAKDGDGGWRPWSVEAVAKAREEGHPVMVDFTADTCVNCKVNKFIAIDIKQTQDKLKEIGAVTLEADFTDADPAIAKILRQYGRAGVPLVLVYPADKAQEPIVLPVVLTPGNVLDALEKARNKSASPAVAATKTK